MLKKIIALLLVLTSCFSHLAVAQEVSLNPQMLIDTIVKTHMKQKAIPGVAIVLYYKGQLYFNNYGYANQKETTPITANTIFEMASITKVFTATLLAVAVKQNKIALQDPIVNYLPSLQKTTKLPIDQVTVMELATHTSSFPRQVTDFVADKNNYPGLFDSLKKWRPTTPIGSHFLYSNIGFGLLGLVVANAMQQDFETLLANEITIPLNMKNTSVVPIASKTNLRAQGYGPKGLPVPFFVSTKLYGGGSLLSTPADMALFLKANLTNPANSTLLSAMQYSQQAYFKVKPKFAMGLGWQRAMLTKHLLLNKDGVNVGFNTYVGFVPDLQMGVVVLTNKSDAQSWKIGNQILSGLIRAESKK